MAIKQFEIYKGEDGKTYWRAVAGNNEVVADGEGYERWYGALNGVQLMLTIPQDVKIIDLTNDPPMELPAELVRRVVEVSDPDGATGGETAGGGDMPAILLKG